MKLINDLLCQLGGCTKCTEIETCAFLKFAFLAMFFGFLCVIVDFIIFKLNKTTYLKLSYINNPFFLILFWTIGSFVVGYIGAAAQLFDTTKIFSALFVGVSWQFIFAKWVAGKFDNEDIQPLNAR